MNLALASTAVKGTATPLAFLLPGQGSQYFQMARSLFEADPGFRQRMQAYDRRLASLGHASVLDQLYAEGASRQQPFLQTSLTHPAIYMLETALAFRLMEKGMRPDCLFATSLGEFAAAAIAGSIDPDEMLECVAACAAAVEKHCPPGGMLAVFAAHEDIRDLTGALSFAASPAPGQCILSGPLRAIEAAQSALAARAIMVARVPVSHAFHSPDMDLATPAVAEIFRNRRFAPPKIPVFSSLAGECITAFSAQHFMRVGREEIRLPQAARNLAAQWPALRLMDVGPSGSTFTIVRQAAGEVPGWQGQSILSPFADEKAEWQRFNEIGETQVQHVPPPKGGPAEAHVFAGQGSQFKGMGAQVLARFPDEVAEADRILGYSISELCLNDPRAQLTDTRYTQPAIFVVNALAYKAYLQDGGRQPQMFAGHSLGEINALHAAGAMDFTTALAIVKRRAALMSEAPAGGMAAILGMKPAAIADVLRQNGLDRIDVANINSPGQTVISGDAGQIAAAKAPFESAGVKAYIQLPVGGAFHSRLMADAEQAFAHFLNDFRFAAPHTPVLSNITAQAYPADDIAGTMARLLSRPVDWVGCVSRMLDQGIAEFIEFAPKPVLSAMVRDIRAQWQPMPAQAAPPVSASRKPKGISAETLGSEAFRKCHGTRYALVCGGMAHGVASADLVVAAARAGMLSFFGTGGRPPEVVLKAILDIQSRLPPTAPYGFNLLNGSNEAANVALYLKHGIHVLEASAYIKVSRELVRYRLKGLKHDGAGVRIENRIIAKLSRPEVARAFLAPAPQEFVAELLREGAITPEEAELSRRIPMADDICVEADSGGHTDQGNAAILIPAICALRDEAQKAHGWAEPVRIGSGGGIGTPDAAMSAIMLGAEFICTGSINQCTPEAGTSDLVKDMLAQADVPDTAYAPAGDMFEIGARVQVLRRGVFFPARANRLFELYMRHDSLEDIDDRTRQQVEEKYFRRSFADIWQDCLGYWPPAAIAEAERNPKQKMAYVFRWYFGLSGRLALQGVAERKVDFQIYCGPSMGAFNQWVAGGPFTDWRQRSVAAINLHLLEATAMKLQQSISRYFPEAAP